MENNSSEKKLFIGNDRKLRFAALFVWWRVSLIFSFLISFIFTGPKSPFLHWLPKLLLCTLGGSVLLMLFIFLILFPLANRNGKAFVALVKKLNAEGMTAECLNGFEELYKKCRSRAVDSDYCDQMAYILANHYTEAGDYAKAHDYFDAIDLGLCKDNISIPTFQARLLSYYALRISIEAADGGRTFAETAYSQAKPYFEKYGRLNEKNAFWAAFGTAEYLLICDKPEEAAKEIEPFTQYTDSKTDAYLILARAAKAMGDNDKANEYYDSACAAAPNSYTREIVNRRRNKAMS